LSFTEIDVLSPCAHRYTITGGILNSISAKHQRIAIIAGANNVFNSPEVKERALAIGIKYIPEWVSNCGNAILYQELLGIEKMPHDYTTYFQQAIRTNIFSFMSDSRLEGISIRQWDEAFIQTAQRRISRASARPSIEMLIPPLTSTL
jgi:glutamate dehydrogenase/leucine dehydrogenase